MLSCPLHAATSVSILSSECVFFLSLVGQGQDCSGGMICRLQHCVENILYSTKLVGADFFDFSALLACGPCLVERRLEAAKLLFEMEFRVRCPSSLPS